MRIIGKKEALAKERHWSYPVTGMKIVRLPENLAYMNLRELEAILKKYKDKPVGEEDLAALRRRIEDKKRELATQEAARKREAERAESDRQFRESQVSADKLERELIEEQKRREGPSEYETKRKKLEAAQRRREKEFAEHQRRHKLQAHQKKEEGAYEQEVKEGKRRRDLDIEKTLADAPDVAKDFEALQEQEAEIQELSTKLDDMLEERKKLGVLASQAQPIALVKERYRAMKNKLKELDPRLSKTKVEAWQSAVNNMFDVARREMEKREFEAAQGRMQSQLEQEQKLLTALKHSVPDDEKRKEYLAFYKKTVDVAKKEDIAKRVKRTTARQIHVKTMAEEKMWDKIRSDKKPTWNPPVFSEENMAPKPKIKTRWNSMLLFVR